MWTAPRADWAYCERRARPEHVSWLRQLTPADVLDLYEEFHSIASATVGVGPAEGLERIERRRWEEKLALRRKLRDAFAALDRPQGRAAL